MALGAWQQVELSIYHIDEILLHVTLNHNQTNNQVEPTNQIFKS